MLQWVRENAAVFGGEIGRVTLFGHARVPPVQSTSHSHLPRFPVRISSREFLGKTGNKSGSSKNGFDTSALTFARDQHFSFSSYSGKETAVAVLGKIRLDGLKFC